MTVVYSSILFFWWWKTCHPLHSHTVEIYLITIAIGWDARHEIGLRAPPRVETDG
jgi:hypothetical protein